MTTSLELADRKFKFSPNGLTIQGEPTFEEWQSCGEQLKYIESAIHWWIGDWLNYGEQRWGEMYSQVLDATDYQKSTLQNIKYVAGKVESSRRREELSFSHHAEVASLSPSKQSELLEKATDQGLTTRQLRQEAKINHNRKPDYDHLVDKIIRLIQQLENEAPDKMRLVREYLEVR